MGRSKGSSVVIQTSRFRLCISYTCSWRLLRLAGRKQTPGTYEGNFLSAHWHKRGAATIGRRIALVAGQQQPIDTCSIFAILDIQRVCAIGKRKRAACALPAPTGARQVHHLGRAAVDLHGEAVGAIIWPIAQQPDIEFSTVCHVEAEAKVGSPGLCAYRIPGMVMGHTAAAARIGNFGKPAIAARILFSLHKRSCAAIHRVATQASSAVGAQLWRAGGRGCAGRQGLWRAGGRWDCCRRRCGYVATGGSWAKRRGIASDRLAAGVVRHGIAANLALWLALHFDAAGLVIVNVVVVDIVADPVAGAVAAQADARAGITVALIGAEDIAAAA